MKLVFMLTLCLGMFTESPISDPWAIKITVVHNAVENFWTAIISNEGQFNCIP